MYYSHMGRRWNHSILQMVPGDPTEVASVLRSVPTFLKFQNEPIPEFLPFKYNERIHKRNDGSA